MPLGNRPITWANYDPVLCHHMMSLGHIELSGLVSWYVLGWVSGELFLNHSLYAWTDHYNIKLNMKVMLMV